MDATLTMLQEVGAFILAGAKGEKDVRKICEMVRQTRGYRWVGIYKVYRGDLMIVAATGEKPPTYPRFPATQGLCGAAIDSRQTIIVGDVCHDPRYLPTFVSTKSEMIVPIISRSENVAGVIDVESDKLNAFSEEDQQVVERVAGLMGQAFR